MEVISKVQGIQCVGGHAISGVFHEFLAGFGAPPSSPILLHPAEGGAKTTFEMTFRERPISLNVRMRFKRGS
jgi:hypothetical protein